MSFRGNVSDDLEGRSNVLLDMTRRDNALSPS